VSVLLKNNDDVTYPSPADHDAQRRSYFQTDLRPDECQEFVERVRFRYCFLLFALIILWTFFQFATQVAIHPQILLNRIRVYVYLPSEDLETLQRVIAAVQSMIARFIEIYKQYAIPVEQLPPGTMPLIAIDLHTMDNGSPGARADPRGQELIQMIRKMAVCGSPSNYYNPAVDDEPQAFFEVERRRQWEA
jgi:hypothetical protein